MATRWNRTCFGRAPELRIEPDRAVRGGPVTRVNALAGVADEQVRAVLVDLAESDGPEVLTRLAKGHLG